MPSIRQYQEIHKALELEGIDRDIKICSILFGKPVEYYESLPLYKLEQVIKKTAFLQDPPRLKHLAPFRKGNNLYKFKTSASQLSTSDFVMLQSFADKGVIENLHSILAILSTRFTILPPREKPQPFEEKEKIFLDCPFELAYGYALFFSAYLPTLQSVGLAYLQGAVKAAKEVTP